METVWNETRNQAESMLKHLNENPESGTLNGLRSIAINVLGHAGYGQNQPWTPDFAQSLTDSEFPSGRLGYFKTIAMVTDKFKEAALVPAFIKKLPFMPSWLQRLGKQMDLVPEYIEQIIAETNAQKLSPGAAVEERKPNFLDALVQFTQSDSQSENQDSKGLYLSKGEVSGNLWIFTGAGFDSTANTLGYAILLLAAYPEWQEWVGEDLKRLESWEYKAVFPRSNRILALMVSYLLP